jgi:hypothetical protein
MSISIVVDQIDNKMMMAAICCGFEMMSWAHRCVTSGPSRGSVRSLTLPQRGDQYAAPTVPLVRTVEKSTAKKR